MPKDMIEKIRKTEEEASAIRKKAEEDAAASIAAASKEAERLYAEAVAEAEKKCEGELEKAKAEAKARIDENRRVAYENAAKVTGVAAGNREAAVEAVVNSVLGL